MIPVGVGVGRNTRNVITQIKKISKTKSMSNDREFTQLGELEKLSDEDLAKIVLEGTNLHYHMSKASVAKRLLDNRRQRRQVEAVEKVEVVTRQLEKSHAEILTIVSGLNEIIGILNFLRTHWFPKRPIWFRFGVFVFGTVLLGILLNLTADWIAEFVFRW